MRKLMAKIVLLPLMLFSVVVMVTLSAMYIPLSAIAYLLEKALSAVLKEIS